jgi:transketolase
MRRDFYAKLINLLYTSKATHIGSCLSCFDVMIEVLLFQMQKEDRFILSKGHAATSLYVLLNHLGKIENEELKTYLRDNTRLTAHPPVNLFSDIVGFHTGSLGHGSSLSCGIAEAMKYNAKLQKTARVPRVYCQMSDGECEEGQVWEAIQYAVRRNLDNIIMMVDKNKIQAFGRVLDVLGDSATREKFESFGLETYETDGNDPKKIKEVFAKVNASKSNKPKIIIFNTTKGFGVSFMEDRLEWHYLTMDENQYKKALEEVKKL